MQRLEHQAAHSTHNPLFPPILFPMPPTFFPSHQPPPPTSALRFTLPFTKKKQQQQQNNNFKHMSKNGSPETNCNANIPKESPTYTQIT